MGEKAQPCLADQIKEKMIFVGLATLLVVLSFTPALGVEEGRSDRDCARRELCNCVWDQHHRECKNVGICVECQEDRDCPRRESCSSRGFCVREGGCRFSSDCPGGGSCKGGRCTECTFNSDCPGSRFCKFDKCTECSFNSDCSGFRTCRFDKCE